MEIDEGLVSRLVDDGVDPVKAQRLAVCEAAARAYQDHHGGEGLTVFPAPP